MCCRTREGSIAITAHAKFGQAIAAKTTRDGVGSPARFAAANASGSMLAAPSEARSTRRGDDGAIIEYTRINTVIHEIWISPTRGGSDAHALRPAMATAFSSMKTRPAFSFVACEAGERWMMAHSAADATIAAISMGIA